MSCSACDETQNSPISELLATWQPPPFDHTFFSLKKQKKVFFYFFFREDWDLVRNGFPKRKKKSNEIGSDDEIKQVCRQIGVPVKVSLIGMAEKRGEKNQTGGALCRHLLLFCRLILRLKSMVSRDRMLSSKCV